MKEGDVLTRWELVLSEREIAVDHAGKTIAEIAEWFMRKIRSKMIMTGATQPIKETVKPLEDGGLLLILEESRHG